ncbi:MAG: hypothetical protein K2N72_11685 [Oscillospiraceae bacterium]|nr:hypothetical protein [Oscillospiraceae bacterium]
MGLFDKESKKKKQDQVELQNIVLDIDEKKLQVSEEFLGQMTKIYISRYMKVVNEHIADMGRLSSIALLFKKYEIINKNLDMLIKIEPYYRYKNVTPSEYKLEVEEKLEHFINSLIAREWKKVKPSNTSVRDDPALESKVRKFFAGFDPFKSKMPQGSLDLLESLYESAFPEEAKTSADKAAEAAAAAIAEAESESMNVFVEETFEDLSEAAAPAEEETPAE